MPRSFQYGPNELKLIFHYIYIHFISLPINVYKLEEACGRDFLEILILDIPRIPVTNSPHSMVQRLRRGVNGNISNSESLLRKRTAGRWGRQ